MPCELSPTLIIEHTLPLFLQFKILDIFKLNAFHVTKFMFCYHHQIVLPLFSNSFLLNNQVHNHFTRSMGDYQSHTCQTNTKKFTVLFQGPSLWNSWPTNITNSETQPCFRKRLNLNLSIVFLLTFCKINYLYYYCS